MSLRRRSTREKNFEKDKEESAAALYNKLGADGTVPQSISFPVGTPVSITTNCFSLKFAQNLKIFQYDVTLEPEILNSRTITNLVYHAICQEGGPMGSNEKWRMVIFDGQHIIYSPIPDLACTVDVPVSPANEKTVKVTIVRTKEIDSKNPESILQVYNTAFSKAYRALGLNNFRRKWIDETKSTKHGTFNIFQGFIPSISFLSSGPSYVIDVANKIDREGTLYDILKEGIGNMSRRSELENAAKSFLITTTHLPKKPKTVKVDAVLWGSNPFNETFEKVDRKTGEKTRISIADYYRDVYQHQCMQDDVLIVMRSRRKDEIFESKFPASVLKITGISDAERKNGRVMRDIASGTRIDMGERKRRLEMFINRMKSDAEASAFLNKWGFEIGESRAITGKMIPPPKIAFGNEELRLDSQTLSYKQNLRNAKMLSVPQYKAPFFFVFPSELDSLAKEFRNTFSRVSKGLGIELPESRMLEVDNTHPNDYVRAVVNEVRKSPPCFVLCLLPDNDRKRYDGIKVALSVHLGVASQCVVRNTIDHGKMMSVATNIAIQIASKTGGALCHISQESLPVSNTMVIGLSMTQSKSRNPVCAGAATTNRSLTAYYSDSCSVDVTGRTIPKDFLEDFVPQAMAAFKERTGEFPKRVVVYRDGVSYGQMPAIKKDEVAPIAAMLNQIAGAEVSLAFLVAQKHSSIRIMRQDSSGAANCGAANCGAGTVVTDGIGAEGVAEFYLVSHYANQGSATPTRYTVIHHAPVSWRDEHLITLTHYLTLYYPNWSGPIRTPAVLMLANRLAEMTQAHLSSEKANQKLRGYLHFL